MSLSFVFESSRGSPHPFSSVLRLFPLFSKCVTCARLLITHSSASLGLFSQQGACRVRHCCHEEVVDCVQRLLTFEEVVEVRFFFFEKNRLLCFISSLLQKLRYLCTASGHPFLLIFRSSVSLIAVLMKKSLIASAVFSVSTRWSNFALLSSSAFLTPPITFQSLPSGRPAHVHGLCRPCFFLP